MRQKKKKRNTVRVQRTIAGVSFLAVCALFVCLGVGELWQGGKMFCVLWGAAAAGIALWGAAEVTRKLQQDAPRAETEDTPDPDGVMADVDSIVGYVPTEAERAARADAEERLRQLEALHELRSVTEEDYEARRREIQRELEAYLPREG